MVEHDHENVGFAQFIGERYRRGREFAAIEATGSLGSGSSTRVTSPRSLRVLLLAPLGIVKRVVFIGRAAAVSSLLADYWLTLPVVLSGVGAWYAGMWAYHWKQLTRGARPVSST